MRLLPLLLLVTSPCASYCQTSPADTTATSYNNVSALSGHSLGRLTSSYASLNTSVNNQSRSLLSILQKKEDRLKERLASKDSASAARLFSRQDVNYQTLSAKLETSATPVNSLKNYVPGIDSLQTAIAYLEKTGLPAGQLAKLQALGQQLTQLRGSLQNAGDIQDYATQREAQLTDQLSGLGFSGELQGMQQKIFSYQQQVTDYKDVLNDGQKQQQLLMAAVRAVPAFEQFWQQNSMLSQLFPVPGNAGTLLASGSLQSSAGVGAIIQQRLGVAASAGSVNAAQYLQQSVSGAQGQVDQLKDKLDQLGLNGSGGTSDMVLPNSAPNQEKRKTFLKRLEYGMNMQSAAATQVLPVITTLGFSLGYKLTGSATVGIGVSYLLGTGNGLTHIQLSNQGAGLRSYLDIKAKGSLWITGGYEYNYLQAFAGIRNIKDLSTWQRSALLGLTKKYSVGKRGGNVQLLYDFLAAYAVPRARPLQLRFGYTF